MGDQAQVGAELVRLNQVANLIRGGIEKGSEIEIKSRVVQLCIDVSTWSLVAILRLERIQVKGEIVRIMTRIRREGRKNFRDQRTDMHKELYTVLVNIYLV